jgi:hypothetical protein
MQDKKSTEKPSRMSPDSAEEPRNDASAAAKRNQPPLTEPPAQRPTLQGSVRPTKEEAWYDGEDADQKKPVRIPPPSQ